jgi:hypothetical protein
MIKTALGFLLLIALVWATLAPMFTFVEATGLQGFLFWVATVGPATFLGFVVGTLVGERRERRTNGKVQL